MMLALLFVGASVVFDAVLLYRLKQVRARLREQEWATVRASAASRDVEDRAAFWTQFTALSFDGDPVYGTMVVHDDE